MKNIFKQIIVAILFLEAKLVLRKYKPRIVAVTGSVGKTSTKDAIFAVMSGFFYVRKSEKSFNSEIGMPLTVLGCENAWNDPVLWLENIWHGIKLVIFKNDYPDWLVLEKNKNRAMARSRTTNPIDNPIICSIIPLQHNLPTLNVFA